MEEAAVVREEKGPVSVLTMQYRPYNLLGPTLIGAIAVKQQIKALGTHPARPERTMQFDRSAPSPRSTAAPSAS